MTTFSYTLSKRDENLSTLGLIVLQPDETIEHDFARLISPEQARQYVTRVPSSLTVSKDSLAAMARQLPASAGLFPRTVHMDVVGYGCTSASSIVGPDEVARLVRSGCDCGQVTEPVSAIIAACRHLGLSRLALLSPYVEEVSASLRATLNKHGILTPVFGSFNEAVETRVANIDKKSLIEAAIQVAKGQQVDGIFLSCTNLKTLDVIADIEAQTEKPVLSSNQALAWHMCHLAGVRLQHSEFGTLLGGTRAKPRT